MTVQFSIDFVEKDQEPPLTISGLRSDDCVEAIQQIRPVE